MTAAGKTIAPPPANRVNFIQKYDTRRAFLGGAEQIAYPRGADTDKHLHKIGTADGEKGRFGFAGYRFGQQGFAHAGRSDQ